MQKIVNYTEQDAAMVVAFIRKVQTDAEPDHAILKRSVLIKDDNDIVGMVSYVSLDNMGVIRYFLYDARIAGTDLIALMFMTLYKNAHADGIKQIAAQAPNKEVGNLFQMLGFSEVSDGAMVINLEQLQNL